VEHDRFRRTLGKIPPAIEIVREKVLLAVRGDDLRVPFVEQIERAAGTADIDGLPQPIEHEDRVIQDALHAERVR
jgi:hypothetical protein